MKPTPRPSRSHAARLALAPLLAIALAPAACAPPKGPAPTPAAELEVDVCASTRELSTMLRTRGKADPKSVRLAHASEWFDLDYAYKMAKLHFEECIDPALEATFTEGPETVGGLPPITATKKFDNRDTGSFTDKPYESSLSRIELQVVPVMGGFELRLSAR